MTITKIKNQARLFIIGTALSILIFLIYTLASTFHYGIPQITPSYLMSLPILILTILVVVHAVLLLRSVVKEEAPFTLKNVQHLYWIGWLFVAYEPLSYIIQIIRNRFFPLRLPDGGFVTSFQSYGGIFLICGFVILSVSTVFRYGMELQQLSDETL